MANSVLRAGMPAPDDVHARSLAPEVVSQAADWYALLLDDADQAARAACAAWRSERPEHELAWQRMASLHSRLEQGAGKVDRAAALQAVEHSVAHAGARRRSLKMLLGMAGLGLGVSAAYRHLPWQAWQAEYRTGTGGRLEIALDDGTRVLLNTDTAFDLFTEGALNELRLHQGEIMVTSGPAGARPLRVRTACGDVQPVGTRFVVRYLPQDKDWTDVVVLDGRVRLAPVDGGGNTLLLDAGQQSRFSRLRIHPAQPIDAAAAAWVDGTLAAQSMRLDDFLRELGRYRPGVLRCAPEVADLRLSGVFPLRDTGQVLQSLEHILPVRLVWRTRYWVSVEPV